MEKLSAPGWVRDAKSNVNGMTAVDLFSGCGGYCLGLCGSLRTIAYAERDPRCIEVANIQTLHTDVQDIAVDCSILLYIYIYIYILRYIAMYCCMLLYIAMYYGVSQCLCAFLEVLQARQQEGRWTADPSSGTSMTSRAMTTSSSPTRWAVGQLIVSSSA